MERVIPKDPSSSTPSTPKLLVDHQMIAFLPFPHADAQRINNYNETPYSSCNPNISSSGNRPACSRSRLVPETTVVNLSGLLPPVKGKQPYHSHFCHVETQPMQLIKETNPVFGMNRTSSATFRAGKGPKSSQPEGRQPTINHDHP